MSLVIRQAQMSALQLEMDGRWYDTELAALYPSFAAATSTERRQWVEQGLKRAAGFGLARPEFFQFLCFEQTFFPGCLEAPEYQWAREILNTRDQNAAERMKRLRQKTIARLIDIETQLENAEQAKAAEAAFAAEEVS